MRIAFWWSSVKSLGGTSTAGSCHSMSSHVPVLQIAAYAGLDICAKVFFGFMVMAAGPIITKQTDRENKE